MGKYREVIEKILVLLNTIEEGSLYIQNQLAEMRYEEAFTVLKDIMEGIASIESAIYPMKNELPENNIDILSQALKEYVNRASSSYEQGKGIYIGDHIEKETLPGFIKWKAEVERILRPYVVS